MKKIPTLFKREFDKRHRIISCDPDFSTPELGEWVLNDCIPTVKVDGSCCAIINGEFYKRYDARKGKKIPDGAIKCQEEPDPITGHLPCWVKVDPDNPADKWFWAAYEELKIYVPLKLRDNSTYEAIGPHFQGNPYGHKTDHLVLHGMYMIDNLPKDFEGIKQFLKETPIEGIVWWDMRKPKPEPVAKLKRSDFGFKWPCEGAIVKMGGIRK